MVDRKKLIKWPLQGGRGDRLSLERASGLVAAFSVLITFRAF